MSEDEFAPVRDLIPDDAMPLHGYRLVEFVDAEGTTRLEHSAVGEVRLSQVIGLLESVKFFLLDDARRQELDE